MRLADPKITYQTTEEGIVHSCIYQIVFCPKNRLRFFTGEIGERLKEMILELQNPEEFEVLEIHILPDQVHLQLRVHPRFGPWNAVSRIKRKTYPKLCKEFPSFKTRLPSLWTRKVFIASVGSVEFETVQKFIDEQKPTRL
jgi:putative transposase